MSGRVAVKTRAKCMRNTAVTKQRPHSDTTRPCRSNKKQGNCKENGIFQLILDKAQETDPCKVYTIDLSAQTLAHMPEIDQFTKTRILDLSCNGIPAITGLNNLCELRELKLYSNKITEITGLEKNRELQNLLLQHNRIRTIGKGFQHVRKLRSLRLDSNQLSTIDHREISGCIDLNVLDISNNMIANISAINSLPGLEELDVSGNRLVKITDISRCAHLQELDLSRNKICDLSGLKGLTNLKIVHLEYNTLTSLVSMGKHRKLQELYASHNKISSIMDMAQQFPSLEVLNLCYNAISSLDEFSHIKQPCLVELFITGNPCVPCDGTDYHQVIHQMIPSIELVDGVSMKRPTSSCSTRTQPLMRPLTASQVLSSRQVEEQLKAAMFEQTSYEESIARRFDTVRSLFDSLPSHQPNTLFNTGAQDTNPSNQRQATADQSRPVSRCSNRSRIAQAQMFASVHHFDEEQE